MTDNTLTDPLTELRKPFPPDVIGKLPKAGVTLDFVGHAHVTDRFLSVDPHWNWEPFALDDRGLPAFDNAGGLWIKLTICGVTRLGYGDGPDPKQRIGDALRNAAMRFGVALDLWAKTDLESQLPNGDGTGSTTRQPPAAETGEMATTLAVAGLHDRIAALPEASRREMGEAWKAAGLSRLEVGRFLASDAADADRLIAAQEAREVDQDPLPESPQTALSAPVGASTPDPRAQDPTAGTPGLPGDIDPDLINEVMGDVEAMDEKTINALLRERGYSVAGGIRSRRVRLFQVLATERQVEAKVAF